MSTDCTPANPHSPECGVGKQDDAHDFAVAIGKCFLFTMACAISSSLMAARSKTRWRSIFTTLVLTGMVLFQYRLVLITSLAVYPGDSVTTDVFRHRCLASDKGGKRSKDDRRPHTVNPCFCLPPATCKVNGQVIEPPTPCPIDGTATCILRREGQKKKRIELYLSPRRDCAAGQGEQCTLDNPCTPCELDRLEEFGATRCTTCSAQNRGDCNFIPGIGPYCLASPSSRKVVPCKQCCTEEYLPDGNLLYVNDECVS